MSNDICDCQGALLPEEYEAAISEPGVRISADCNVVDLDAPTVEIETDDPLQQRDGDA